MKKSLILTAVALSTVLSGTAAFASAWNVPSDMRVVQKSNTDTTGRIYGTIQAAINSITNASATNPYVVKVMPGVYNETVTLKPYVTIEGSGADSTVISASSAGTEDCSTGTVFMANNSSIKNIKVVNVPPVGSGGDEANALVFNDVAATAEGVTVVVGSDTDQSVYRTVGVCTTSANANVALNNMRIEAHNVGGQTNSIRSYGGKLLLTNSRVFAYNLSGEGKVIDTFPDLTNSGTAYLTVLNTIFESNEQGGVMLFLENTKTLIKDSVFTCNAVTYNEILQNYTSANTKISNSKFVSSIPAVYYNNSGEGATLFIDNSELPSDYSALQGDPAVKLFNNYDANFVAIPNQ